MQNNLIHPEPRMDTNWQQMLLQLFPDRIPSYKNRFLIRKGHQLISLPVSEVRYFYSKDKITFAKTLEGKDFIMDFPIGEIEKMVSPELFFRVSRQYIISHAAINKVLVWFNGKLKLEVQPTNTDEIIISRERVNSFKAWMGE